MTKDLLKQQEKWHKAGWEDRGREIIEMAEGLKINISDKVKAEGNYKYALLEVKKHEQSYNKALSDLINKIEE